MQKVRLNNANRVYIDNQVQRNKGTKIKNNDTTVKQTTEATEIIETTPQPEQEVETQTQEAKSVPQTDMANGTKTIVKEDGSKVILVYDEAGLIAKSTIRTPEGTSITKQYKNGKIIESTSLNIGKRSVETSEYEYVNGKIAKITTSGNEKQGNTIKTFQYDKDGKFSGYKLEANNQVKIFDHKGKLTKTENISSL